MKKFADIFILASGVLWGVAGFFVNHLIETGFTAVQVSALRWIFAATLMTVGIAIFDPKKLRIDPRDLGWFFCTGIVCILLSNTLYFIAIPLTTVAVANILMYTSPIWILLFSVIVFREKVTFSKISSLVLAVVGCAFAIGVIGGEKHAISPLGVVAGVLSGLFYGLYSIFGKIVLKKYDSITVILYTAIFAGLGSFFIINIPETISYIAQTNTLPIIFLMAVIVSILPYTFYTIGLKNCKATRASILACVEPITSVLVGTFILGQPFTIYQFIGIMMILGAGIILQTKKH